MSGYAMQITKIEVATIREALEHLPKQCKYHGDELQSGTRWYGGACCETGRPSLARRNAEAVLALVERS
jgi:hypothetical protein